MPSHEAEQLFDEIVAKYVARGLAPFEARVQARFAMGQTEHVDDVVDNTVPSPTEMIIIIEESQE